MKEYEDKNKQNKLQEVMQDRKQVSFNVIQQLVEDEIVEDYDTFKVVSHYKDMLMFYLDGGYYLIDEIKKDFRRIPKGMLQHRYFLLNRCMTNNVQGFIQKYGEKVFNKLSTQEFIEVMLRHKNSLLNLGEER